MHAPASFRVSFLGLLDLFFFVFAPESFHDSPHGLTIGLEAGLCSAEACRINRKTANKTCTIIEEEFLRPY
jgi:hypothetical protein